MSYVKKRGDWFKHQKYLGCLFLSDISVWESIGTYRLLEPASSALQRKIGFTFLTLDFTLGKEPQINTESEHFNFVAVKSGWAMEIEQ